MVVVKQSMENKNPSTKTIRKKKQYYPTDKNLIIFVGELNTPFTDAFIKAIKLREMKK